MKAVLDNILFNEEEFELEIKSPKREILRRSAMGLDGEICIDLGLRGRKIVQKGILRSQNENELQRKIAEIAALIDGQLHTLKCPNGRIFSNMLIEQFETDPIIKSGAQASSSYQIIFIQQG
ncbi:MAG: hypothetical protein ABFD79_18660 [Phycisphaerales bacterium]